MSFGGRQTQAARFVAGSQMSERFAFGLRIGFGAALPSNGLPKPFRRDGEVALLTLFYFRP
jgi:hypothetical protein